MKKIIEWIKSLFIPKPDRFLGVLGDGSDQEKIIPLAEAVGEAAFSKEEGIFESDKKKWRNFLHQFQNGSGGCVAFTLAKIAQILFFLRTGRRIKFSPGWVYKKRFNKPASGMYIGDIIKLGGQGIITEDLYPSEDLSDFEMDNLPDIPYGDDVAEAFAIPENWVDLPKDFDVIAKTVRKTEKGVMLWVQFGKGEFFNKAIPISNGSRQEYRHSITVVDAVEYKEKKYLLTEDSADLPEDTELDGKDFDARKLISEEWFKKHFILARYPLGFHFDDTEEDKPKYDGSIISLQNCLKYEGFFPSNVPSTGYFGPITIEAIQKFQVKYGIVYSGTPETTGYGNDGPKTKAKLYQLYS